MKAGAYKFLVAPIMTGPFSLGHYIQFGVGNPNLLSTTANPSHRHASAEQQHAHQMKYILTYSEARYSILRFWSATAQVLRGISVWPKMHQTPETT